MNNHIRFIHVIASLVIAFLLTACDAEVKVDTNRGDSTSESNGDGDTTGGSADEAGATSNGSGTNGTNDDDKPDNGDNDDGGTNGGNNDGGNDDDTGPHTTGNIRVSSPQPGDMVTGRRFTLSGECRT